LTRDPATFRREIRAWLEANCPPSMRTPMPSGEEVWGGSRVTFPSDDAKRWFERAVAKGLTAPTWAVEYGGAGYTDAEAQVLAEEMRALGCRRPLQSLGLWMLGPTLLEYGSDEQKREHLPGIARGETRWCQGYSEPGAGSDLASLDARAVRDGDVYVVNGQKVWTSHADKADWMFCLVRTDPSAAKHDGISFLVVDMKTPGIKVRPILLISGHSPFCETFFDDVRVPVKNRVGRENGGWEIGKRLLQYERTIISNMRDAASEDGETLDAMAKRTVGVRDGRIADPVLRDRVVQANLDFLCNRLTMQRTREAAQAGHGPGAASSMFKYYGTELSKRRKELRVVLAGTQGLGWDGDGYGADELQYTRDWLRSRASSIEGGTSEIQLNIIAKRVLGLPDRG
jgi:alkylation response protein AidB-like acyl-CoA dehydrogenase